MSLPDSNDFLRNTHVDIYYDDGDFEIIDLLKTPFRIIEYAKQPPPDTSSSSSSSSSSSLTKLLDDYTAKVHQPPNEKKIAVFEKAKEKQNLKVSERSAKLLQT